MKVAFIQAISYSRYNKYDTKEQRMNISCMVCGMAYIMLSKCENLEGVLPM